MTIQETIKKAIEGGYEITGGQDDILTGHDPQFHSYSIDMTVLDPAFWSALGKAMGWDRVIYRTPTPETKQVLGKRHEAGSYLMEYPDASMADYYADIHFILPPIEKVETKQQYD